MRERGEGGDKRGGIWRQQEGGEGGEKGRGEGGRGRGSVVCVVHVQLCVGKIFILVYKPSLPLPFPPLPLPSSQPWILDGPVR